MKPRYNLHKLRLSTHHTLSKGNGDLMSPAKPALSNAEINILKWFRSYGVRPNALLFINRSGGKDPLPGFTVAMQSMISRGWVHQSGRHRDAYSLSAGGYEASRRVEM